MQQSRVRTTCRLVVAAIVAASMATCTSGCRRVPERGSPSNLARQPEPPSPVALQKGVIVVFAVSNNIHGDNEEVMEIVDVTPEEVQIKYTTQKSTNDPLQHDFTRFVRRNDLISAHRVFGYRANRLPPRFPGTTSFGPSSAVLRELKAGGRTSYTIYLGRPDAPKAVLSVDELLRQRLMSSFTGELTQVAEAGPVDPVLVDGEPVILPTIRARGALINDAGERVSMELWFLDDLANPLTLKSASSVGTSQVTKIFTPRGVNRADRLDRDLSVAGRADVYDIFFDFGNPTLRSESEPALAQIAAVLRSHNDWGLSIEGHTDNIGRDEDNQVLSERRADGVKTALVARYQIASSRLSSRGLGESRPKASNDTLVGRATNRRVELRREDSRGALRPAAAGGGDDRGSSPAVMPLPVTEPNSRPLIDPLMSAIVMSSGTTVWLLTVLGMWVSLSVPVVLFVVVRRQYLRTVRASLYRPGTSVRPEAETAGAVDTVDTTAPRIQIVHADQVPSNGAMSQAVLAAALGETRRQRAAYAFAGIAYLITATYLVWYDRGHNSVHSPREAIYVAYVTTAPSVVLIVAALRIGVRRSAVVALGWIGGLLLLLVGVFRVEWGTALNLMAVDAAPWALMPVAANALLLLRITRAMLVLLVPVMVACGAAGGLMMMVIGMMGGSFSELLQGVGAQSLASGLVTALSGVTIAALMIRASFRTWWIAALVAVAGVGLIGAPRMGFMPAFSVSFNALVALAAWWLFTQFARARGRGYLTDDLLHFSVCWFLLLFYVAAFSGNRWSPVPVAALPFAAYALVLALVLVIQTRSRRRLARVVARIGDRPRRLLLLRVFGTPAIRRRLLDLMENSWCHVGRVDVIVGIDVALRTLSASTLETFLRGRIARHYIGADGDLPDRLAKLPDAQMVDGRYPINELHCFPDIWPDVVTRLACEADVVLIDVRRLRTANTGALFELSLAIQRVPLERIVVLDDERTDRRAVSETIAHAWARLPPDSPNLGKREAWLGWVSCEGSPVRADRRIMTATFAAAFRAPNA